MLVLRQMSRVVVLLLFAGVNFLIPGVDLCAQFRVQPYLQSPAVDGIRVTWFSEVDRPGHLFLAHAEFSKPRRFRSDPVFVPELAYSALEEQQRGGYPDMFANANYKHQVVLSGLEPGESYLYIVVQGAARFNGSFKVPPSKESGERVRLIVLADSETDPDGRNQAVLWGDLSDLTYVKAPGGESRSNRLSKNDRGLAKYVASQQVGLARNVRAIQGRKPDLILFPGDLVQGGGYQRAWDEFFRHFSGRLSNVLGHHPILPALGNWENYGARNGDYAPDAVLAARQKYRSYFDLPSNGNRDHQDLYYRVDYGPVTVLTMDTSNGLPDNTDADTNSFISAATYPGRDLPDFNQGSDQWLWMMRQLEDAYRAGQIIFVQFHHPPFSSGRHGYRFTSSAPRRDGQSGYPLRKYAPYFEQFGVVAVFSGHSELFERSVYRGVHYYDVGVAGDGLRSPEPSRYAQENNPYSVWMAHRDEPEMWENGRLVSGGKHYGHLEVNVTKSSGTSYRIELVPVHVFPVMDAELRVREWQRRVYNDTVIEEVDVSERSSEF